jgi:intein/homing endonuclease
MLVIKFRSGEKIKSIVYHKFYIVTFHCAQCYKYDDIREVKMCEMISHLNGIYWEM